MELEGKVINFLGDSITEGAGVANPENIYVNRLKRMCKLNAANNYGISGTRFAHQSNPTVDAPRFDLDFCMRSVEMEKNADVVIVMGGTNDFGHGDAPLGEFSDRTPNTFYGACHTLMSTLRAEYLSGEIVICTPLHRQNENVPTGDHKPEPVGTLKTYVDIIREVAQYYSLPILDLYAMSGLQPAVPQILERYMPDGLHPNDAGHEILARRIAAFLKTL